MVQINKDYPQIGTIYASSIKLYGQIDSLCDEQLVYWRQSW